MPKKSNAQRKENTSEEIIEQFKTKKAVKVAKELEQMADAVAEMVAEDESVVDKKKVVIKVELTDDQLIEYNELKTKSSQIRYLASLNYGRSSIASHLGIRYQHVRNVLETPLKRTV